MLVSPWDSQHIDFTNLGAAVTNLIAAGAIPASDKVHAFLLHATTIFLRHGGAQLDDGADTADRNGFLRGVADLLGDNTLLSARTQAEYAKKQCRANLIASLILGITSPGALVCLYMPEAGIEFPAPGVQLAANANRPALTLQDQAQVRYFSTLFAKHPAVSRDGRTEERIAAALSFPAGIADVFWAHTALSILEAEGLELLFVDDRARGLVDQRVALSR